MTEQRAIDAARRVAGFIGIVKWALIAVYAAGTLLAVVALGTWVLFGWFQHTLRMLALTAGMALRTNPPVYLQPAPH